MPLSCHSHRLQSGCDIRYRLGVRFFAIPPLNNPDPSPFSFTLRPVIERHIRVDADANVVESVDESGKVKHISGDRGAAESKRKASNNGGGAGRNDVHSSGGSGDPSSAAAGGGATEEFSTPRQLVQYYMSVTQKLRLPALCAFLRARSREKVVVFMSTCDAVDFHHDLFRRAGWPGDAAAPSPGAAEGGGEPGKGGGTPSSSSSSSKQAGVGGGGGGEGGKAKAAAKAGGEFFGPGCLVRRLHGNVPQNERQATYRAFGAAKSGVLICTDVAARGLDLPTVDWIVQYDPPAETADYVHRVGRTARKGERGHSLLFLLPREAAYLGVLEARGLRPKPLSLEGVLCAADAGKRDARRADEQVGRKAGGRGQCSFARRPPYSLACVCLGADRYCCAMSGILCLLRGWGEGGKVLFFVETCGRRWGGAARR